MNPVRYHHLVPAAGPRIALASVPWSPAAAFGVWIPAGSRDDPAGRSGLAHFVEHMTFKGTRRRSSRDLSFEIEGHGGQINAATSEDHTCYDARGEAELLPLLADVVCDLVWQPIFPAAELELEREVIREEIALYYETPSDHITDLLAKALWSPHPLGESIVGTSQSIDRITRDDLAKHTSTHHSRNDVVIAVAGPFEPRQLEDLIAAHLPAGPPDGTPSSRPYKPDTARNPAHISEHRDNAQCHLAIGYHTPGRHDPTRHALRMLSLILGENCSSRLFQELREKQGLCYHVGSDVAMFDETGALEITVALDREKRDQVIDSIQAELDDLATNGPTEEELERAKRYAIGQSRISFESTSTHLAWAAETLLHYDHIIDPEDSRARIQAVTAEQVAEAAASTFQPGKRAFAEILDS